jgi:hypothetical protein
MVGFVGVDFFCANAKSESNKRKKTVEVNFLIGIELDKSIY